MLLRSTLIYAPAILLTRISALLLLVIATRLVDQTEYGLLTLVLTVGEMTDMAVTNWLRIALLRLGGKGDVTRGTVALAARVLLACTLVSLAIAVGASALVVPERWADFALAVGAYLVAGSFSRFGLTVLQMQQRHGVYSAMEFLRAALQLALPVAAITVLPASFLVVSLGTSLGVLLAGLVALALALGRLVGGPPRFTHAAFFALGMPLVIMAVVGFGMNSAERVLLKFYYDAGTVAIFAAAYALARQPIDMLANAVNMGAFPEVVSRFDNDGPEAAGRFLGQLLALMLALTLPAAAMLVALSDPLTQLLLPAEYHGQFGWLFPLIAASVVLSNLTNFVYGDVIHAHKRPWLLIWATSAGSVGTIGLSLLLIPTLAADGAAIALLGGSVTAFAVLLVISERLTPIPLPWREIGMAVLVAAVTGGMAALASTSLEAQSAPLRLATGAMAGGGAFLALNALFRFEQTRAGLSKLRRRVTGG